MKPWHIPILYFHHVSPNIDYYTNTKPDIFERQISYLKDNYDFWTLSEAHEAFIKKESPKNKIVITFDDGYKDNNQYALKILNKYNLKATFFILPLFVNKLNTWNSKCHYRASHMNWKEINELIEYGNDIGSHGLTHVPLTNLGAEEIKNEMELSKKILEDNLKKKIISFSYPYGITNKSISETASNCYDISLSTVKSNYKDWNNDIFHLKRIYIPNDATNDIIHKTIKNY